MHPVFLKLLADERVNSLLRSASRNRRLRATWE